VVSYYIVERPFLNLKNRVSYESTLNRPALAETAG
jgi:hypothetical protein